MDEEGRGEDQEMTCRGEQDKEMGRERKGRKTKRGRRIKWRGRRKQNNKRRYTSENSMTKKNDEGATYNFERWGLTWL